MNLRSYYILLVITILLSSCSTTRYIPQGESLLKKNIIQYSDSTPKKQRIPISKLEKYIKQDPNKHFLGTNLYVGIYNLANPEKNTFFGRIWRRVGESAAILDTIKLNNSINNLNTFMVSSGYFNAKNNYTIKNKNQKSTVTYHINQGLPYQLGNITYEFKDEVIGMVIMSDSSSTILHKGDIFNESTLNEERSRISTFLKNQGYFSFSIEDIIYEADSTIGNKTVDLKMIVKQYTSGYNKKGAPILDNYSVYRLNNIYINTDYNPTKAATDSTYKSTLDTIQYNGLHIIYKKKLNLKKELLRNMIDIYPNDIYQSDLVNKTYSNIMRLGYYKSASILFEAADDMASGLVTYVGSDEQNTAHTQEEYLNCTILCTPALSQSYNIELETTVNENYYSIQASLGYQNRNILRGAEVLDVNFSAGYDFHDVAHTKNTKLSYEIGATVGLSFPELITPFEVDKYNRLNNPSTRLELSISAQNRPYYERIISGINWGYSWNNKKNSTYVFRPINVSVIDVEYIDKEYLESLKNKYLQKSYEPQLILGISTSYIYNNQKLNINKNSMTIRIDAETSGNLATGISNLLNAHKTIDTDTQDSYYKIFNIRYAQYARILSSFSNSLRMSDNSSLVYRFVIGAALAYGNSPSVIPYDRLFFAGGSNSMRGWGIRTLGPGSSKIDELKYPSQVGNFRLEANLEYRFPVWEMLHGAIFCDVGNIWYLQEREYNDPNGIFHFNSFYKQLGFNTGLGARVDLNFIILRLDWGIKLHDPNRPIGDRWIQKFDLKEGTALSFGVGYPF